MSYKTAAKTTIFKKKIFLKGVSVFLFIFSFLFFFPANAETLTNHNAAISNIDACPTCNNINRKEISIASKRSYTVRRTGNKFSLSTSTENSGDDDLASANADFDKLSLPHIAKLLGWVHDASQKNLCGGYYLDPPIITQYPKPVSPRSAPITITATKPALFSQYGTSTLSGNVTVTQPGRQVIANKATFYREAASGEVKTGTLAGNVHLREYGKLIVAKDVHWDFDAKSIVLNNGIYRTITPSPTGTVNAWGRARKVLRDAAGVLHLTHATYTTCPPDRDSWRLSSSTITLNKNTGRGSATNTLFYLRSLPIFYAPYFNFPIDKRRKSGFLYPTFSYSNSSGADIALPYYFNLAPNYDFTFTPRILDRRGLLGEGLWRYLTPHHFGALDVSYIPHDREFAHFKKASLLQEPSDLTRYPLSRLKNDSNDRGYVSYFDIAHLNEHWSSGVNVNYVTDDYFFKDFGGGPPIDSNQLFNQVNIAYTGEVWNFSGLVQAFQTLHPFDQLPTAQDQYRRLPQLNLNGVSPIQRGGFEYQLDSEFINFDFDHEHDPVTQQLMPIGGRLNITPIVSWPYQSMAGYFIPRLEINSTVYGLRNNELPNGDSANNIGRVLPVFSIDSGLLFERDASLFGHGYTQTLEPRAFYLFVPIHNQSDIPNFDSNLSIFSFDQLFATNRFSGKDRIGDANQVSVAVSTRLLDSYSALEKFRASAGVMLLAEQHKVCLANDPSCEQDFLAHHNVSPIIGEVQYNLTPDWAFTLSGAWKPTDGELSNSSVNLSYNAGGNRIAGIGYNFVENGDPESNAQPKNSADTMSTQNLNRINLFFAWPFREHWNVVGDWNYNLSYSHPQEYFYGVEYQNCCWAARLVQSQTFYGTDVTKHDTFQRALYLQIMLKGLGSAGTAQAGSLLTSRITGYRDNFSGGL